MLVFINVEQKTRCGQVVRQQVLVSVFEGSHPHTHIKYFVYEKKIALKKKKQLEFIYIQVRVK